MVSVIAKIPVKEDKMNDALEAFKQLMAEVAKEKGTLYYTLNRSKAQPDTLVVMERYTDPEALAAHSSTSHFQHFMTRAAELFSGQPEITVMQELASI